MDILSYILNAAANDQAMVLLDGVIATTSVGAIIVSVVALVRSNEANRNADKQQTLMLKLSQAEFEINAQLRVDAAWGSLNEITFRAAQLGTAEGTPEGALMRDVVKQAGQRVCNAHDALCQAYLDDKIDKERFKRAWSRQITALVDSKQFPDLEGHASDYKAITTVYNEFRGAP